MNIIDIIKDFFSKLFGSLNGPSFKKFADPNGPFKGYGLVNNWSAQDAKKYMEALVSNDVQFMAFEFFEWGLPEKFADVDNLLKKFEKYLDLSQSKKMNLYVTLLNCNLGSGKYDDPRIKAPTYNVQIMKAANQFAVWMKKYSNIYLTPCGEGGNQSPAYEKTLQSWCKQNMPLKQLVNNWASRPTNTDGMGFLCQHPASTKSPFKLWVMSDHGLLIKELNGGGLYGKCNYNITMSYAKKVPQFIYYHFDRNGTIDMEALRALKDSQK